MEGEALRMILLGTLLLAWCAAVSAAEDVEWFSEGLNGERRIVLYYFHSETCPVCTEAKPFIEALREVAWLDLRSYEVSTSRDNALKYRDIAAAIGGQARSVPAFIACRAMLTGYNGPEPTFERLAPIFERCLPRE